MQFIIAYYEQYKDTPTEILDQLILEAQKIDKAKKEEKKKKRLQVQQAFGAQ